MYVDREREIEREREYHCVCVSYNAWARRGASTYMLQKRLRRSPLTPVAGLFLTQLCFEKIFKTQWVFKIKERFQVILEEFKYSREKSSTLWTLLGSKNPK